MNFLHQLFVLTLSIFTNIAVTIYFMLNFFLSHNLLCSIIYKEINFKKRFQKYIFSTILVSLVSSIINGLADEIGYDPIRFCWLMNKNSAQIINFILALIVFSFSIGSMLYVL